MIRVYESPDDMGSDRGSDALFTVTDVVGVTVGMKRKCDPTERYYPTIVAFTIGDEALVTVLAPHTSFEASNRQVAKLTRINWRRLAQGKPVPFFGRDATTADRDIAERIMDGGLMENLMSEMEQAVS
jgi:hypothetical protein